MFLVLTRAQRVIDFVTETITEVIENYDVTGVHIDDYFYPYSKVPRELEEEDYQAALKEKPGFITGQGGIRNHKLNS